MSSRVNCIRKACSIVDEIFSLLLENMKPMKTEKDIDNFLRKEMRKRKLKIAFPPVVASAGNASEIHHKPKKTRLKKGFLVIDFGVKYRGYCSDMTRTLYIGKASAKEREMYGRVLAVQMAGVKKCRPGVECFEIDSFARRKFGKERDLFIHSLGHGVGKKIHEKPNLSPRSVENLKSRDIVTVEPGIYKKKKFGIRIEDTVLVGEKPVALTKTTKKLIEIN